MNIKETEYTLHCRFDTHIDTVANKELEPILEEAIAKALEKQPELTVDFDLSDTQYIASAFLRLCIRYCKQIGRSRFRILNPNDNVKNVFEISGLTGVMTIVSTAVD